MWRLFFLKASLMNRHMIQLEDLFQEYLLKQGIYSLKHELRQCSIRNLKKLWWIIKETWRLLRPRRRGGCQDQGDVEVVKTKHISVLHRHCQISNQTSLEKNGIVVSTKICFYSLVSESRPFINGWSNGQLEYGIENWLCFLRFSCRIS